MKRFLSICAVIFFAVSCLWSADNFEFFKLPQEQPVREITREDLENAISEVALDFHVKGPKIQYDSQELTWDPYENRVALALRKFYGGAYRLTEFAKLEYGTSDTTVFSVCSDYIDKVYNNALGFDLLGHPLNAITDGFWYWGDVENMTLLRWKRPGVPKTALENTYSEIMKEETFKTTDEVRNFLRNWATTMRPGDVIINDGHTELYVGNGFVLDCWGAKYNVENGVDSYEEAGSVSFLHRLEDIYLDGTDKLSKNSYVVSDTNTKDANRHFAVFRPLNIICDSKNRLKKDYYMPESPYYIFNEKTTRSGITILPETYTRMQYPAMDIDRTVDISPFGTAVAGEEITYTVKIYNKSNLESYRRFKSAQLNTSYNGQTYEKLQVMETIPENTEYVSSNGHYKDGIVEWITDVLPGECAVLQYTVKVTGKKGDLIVNNGGYVGNIPSNTITNRIGGKKLNNSKNLSDYTHLTDVEKIERYGLSTKYYGGLKYAEKMYSNILGIDLNLPSVEELVNSLFKPKHIERKEGLFIYKNRPVKAEMYELDKSSEYEPYLVHNFYGGTALYTENQNERINEFFERYMESGDICVSVDFSGNNTVKNRSIENYNVIFILDDNNAVKIPKEGNVSYWNTKTLLYKAYTSDLFFCIRPSQYYSDINANKFNGSIDRTIYEVEGNVVFSKKSNPDIVKSLLASCNSFISKKDFIEYDKEGSLYYVHPEYLNETFSWRGDAVDFILSLVYDGCGIELTQDSADFDLVMSPKQLFLNNPGLCVKYDYNKSVSAADYLEKFEVADILMLRTTDGAVHYLFNNNGKFISFTKSGFVVYSKQQTEALLAKTKTAALLRPAALQNAVDCKKYNALGLSFAKNTSVGNFHSVVKGSIFSIEISVANNDNKERNIDIEEGLPSSLGFVSATDGGTFKDGKVLWNFALPAGAVKKVSYTVKANGKVGDTLVLDGGTVNGASSGLAVLSISGEKLSASNLKKLTAVKETDYNNIIHISFADAVYASCSINITNPVEAQRGYGTPTFANILTDHFKNELIDEYYYYSAGENDDIYVKSLVKGLVLGAKYLQKSKDIRVYDIKPQYLEAGDIVAAGSRKPNKLGGVYVFGVYLGNGQFIFSYRGDINADGSVSESVKKVVKTDNCSVINNPDWDVVFVLRPSLFYDNVNNTEYVAPQEKDPAMTLTVKNSPANLRSVVNGKEITYKVVLENKSKQAVYYNVSYKVPNGTTEVKNNVVSSFELAPRKKTELSLTVKVNSTRGSVIDFSGFDINGTKAGAMINTVITKPLPASFAEGLQNIAAETTGTNMTYVENLYGAMGVPFKELSEGKTVDGFRTTLCSMGYFAPESVPGYEKLYEMVIPSFYGGTLIKYKDSYAQVREFDPQMFETGDIFMLQGNGETHKNAYILTGVVIGGGRIALSWRFKPTEEVRVIEVLPMTEISELLTRCMKTCTFYMALRPSLAFDDAVRLK